MGQFVNNLPTKIIGYLVCTGIAALNVYLLYDTIGWKWLSVIAAVMIAFTVWVTFFYHDKPEYIEATEHGH